jgi:hypothetical protein
MDELEKLKMLLYHWMEHNKKHAQTYREWAERASPLDNRELSEILRKLTNKTEKLNRLLKKP